MTIAQISWSICFLPRMSIMETNNMSCVLMTWLHDA